MLAGCSAPAPVAGSTAVPIVRAKPDWFNIKMTDVRTGQTFSINDFAGKVVLLETMATWCINCVTQDKEVKKLEALGYSQDMVVVSLDEDLSEMQPHSKNMQIHLASIGTLRFPRWQLIGRSAIYRAPSL